MSTADRSSPAGREEVGRVLRDLIDAGYFAGRTEDVRALPAALEAAEAALVHTASTAPGVPEGYKLVPVEPTGKMWSAGRSALAGPVEMVRTADRYEVAQAHVDRMPEKVWVAMLAAAPTPPAARVTSARAGSC